MKFLIVIALALTASAHAKTLTESQIALCSSMESYAGITMLARQQGVPKVTMVSAFMKTLKAHPNAPEQTVRNTASILSEAYKWQVYRSAENKRRAVVVYADLVFDTCLETRP